MNDKSELHDLGPSNISFDELRMKQSVRTTFRLPKEIINLLGLIASQLGIKQKSLLDQLIEDASLLHELGKEVKQAFVLPRYVVYPGDIVYTVKENRLKIIEIDVLRSYKDSVIVNQGIEDGEQILKTPLAGAADGMIVRVKP